MVIVFDRYTEERKKRLEGYGFRCVELGDRVECYKKLNEVQDYIVVLKRGV
jgi:hypothetical protein